MIWIAKKHKEYTGDDITGGWFIPNQTDHTQEPTKQVSLFDFSSSSYMNYFVYAFCCTGLAGTDLNKRK